MATGNEQHTWLETFYKGLQTLVDSTFPKTCPKCSRTYASKEEFLRETIPVKDISLEDKSGLFALEAFTAEDNTTIGVFRNCECGTTLMADFQDRRDNSEAGQQRREQFDKLMQMLTEHGMKHELARHELLEVLHGKHSEIIDDLLGDVTLP
jgi:hypothetical protein